MTRWEGSTIRLILTLATDTAEWVYDVAPGAGIGKLAAMIGAPDPKLKGPCTIPNTSQTSGNRAGRSFTYTQFGDVAQVDECIDGETFSTNYQYDNLGRQSVVTYPALDGTAGSRFAVEYDYTNLGFLQYVADASDHKPYWVAKSMNAAGQVTDEYTRNGVETVSTRNPSTGWLMNATTTAVADGNTLIQKWTNTYDEAGNLRSRARSQPTNMADSVESFGYDSLDRLTLSEVKIPSENYDAPEIYKYDDLGNLTQKGGQFYDYTGCGGRAHAVCQVGNTSYRYDSNGNMINASFPEVATGKAITYNAANKVTHITSRPASTSNDTRTSVVDFVYGADGNRVVQLVGTADQGESARTVYVGMGGTGKSMYERTTHTTTGATEHVHFLYAGGAHGGNAFAIRVVTPATQTGSNSSNDPQSNPTVAMHYQHFDHLGSVTASTDEYGRVVGASGGANTTVLGYDSWGARRNPDGRPATGTPALQPGHREFTSHETIPSVGLVNMNGRVYDPALGRFLSPDPNVQFVADLQSYNRYSYVQNNPLRYTDPTGYGFWSFLTSSNFWIGLTLGAMDAIACAGTGGAGCVAMMAITTYYQSSTMLVSGVPFDQVAATTLFGIAAGALGGAIGGGIAGQLGTNPAWQVLGGAIAGTVSGALTTLAFGGSLGQNIFLGAASGAMSASLAWAAQGNNPLSQGSAAESQGGGSNAARLEEIQSRLAVLEGQLPSDEQLNDILGPGDGFTNEERGTVMLERLKIEHEIQLEQDAANLYKAYQNAADRGDMLDDWTMSNLRQKYSSLRVSGTTSGSTGSVDCSDNPDPIFREACEEHEGVHHNTWRNGIGQFGGTTPAFEQWWKNPVNWGNDEIAAYGASTRYFQLALGWL
jgi:RHS repeat-associated protein